MSPPTRCPDPIPFGDAAYLLRLPGAQAQRLWRALLAAPVPGLRESIPASDSLLLLVDPGAFDPASLNEAWQASPPAPAARELELPVVYGGEHGPDLADVARETGLAADEVVALHAGTAYDVAMLGFTPGFPYLAGLAPALQVPRLATPRTRVAAGSVGLAGPYTGVYPQAGPGGWRIIGRTPTTLFHPDREPPVLLAPGDRVRFRPVPSAEFPEPPATPFPAPTRPALAVLAPGWQSTVQDGGRCGWQAFGIAPAGAVDAASCRRANRLVGNPAGSAVLELIGRGPRLRLLRALRIAVSGGDFPLLLDGQPAPAETALDLPRGTLLEVGHARFGWRAYLAVRGGIEAPLMLGSRATHLRAGFGGLGGRALARGNVVGACVPGTCSPGPAPTDRRPVRWASLLVAPIKRLRLAIDPRLSGDLAPPAGVYQVLPASDRMGLRLAGPPIAGAGPASATSHGVPLGTVQVDGQGQPLILLAERGTTGGYPCLGAVAAADHWLLGQLRPGDRVRFQLISPSP